MRVAFIGDVHGHERELIALIQALEDHGVDRIVSLGDLLDRGPRSIACLRIMRDWEFTTRDGVSRRFEMIQGNHEDAYLRVFDQVPKPGRVGIETPEDRKLSASLSREDEAFMRSLPVSLNIPELVVTAVHGGVTPHQETIDEFSLRVRYLGQRGNPLRSTAHSRRFWADHYDGRFGLIVFGHESHSAPTLYENALALDGEGFRKLHGAVISDERGDEWLRAWTIRYGEREAREVDVVDAPERVHDRILRRTYSSALPGQLGLFGSR